MASQPEVSEVSSAFERLIRSRDMSIFLPFIFGFSNTLQRPDFPQPDQTNERQSDNDNDNGNRVILINPFTQGMVVIEGASGLDSLLRELGGKGGPPPAARSAIEALPRVEISEDCGDQECPICLDEFGVGGFAKEMPCKHRFHEDCVDKWLGIHGSCPVCRHRLPGDENETKKRVFEREIWVSFAFSGGRRRRSESESESVSESVSVSESEGSNQSPSSGGGDDGSSNGGEVQG